ncbi:hypothetical protein WICMUC_001429 [Wickerhamomyces mucosus]|uniref:Transporter n=1 Tax=Wickerhamomyces mucosus TaxID=1378264 RepID=A0A9P8PUJ0_9ASCO|nr:hypothetical protein WICMUC_001429 [Wickerhamomyces mucosus]
MTLVEELSFTQVSFLTFQAIIQVILVCFAGFWAAKTGLLNKTAQKNVSILNVDLFTPALIFSKLAKSLSLKKLLEIIIIPIFYAISTGISFIVSQIISRYLELDEPETNFVTAMSVFGNSNSLPVSLTVALSYTLPNLEWDDVEDDSPDKVASRGILYLLIFQQIGQVLRWSWGYNTLLRRRSSYDPPTNLYTIDAESGISASKNDGESVSREGSIASNSTSRLLNDVPHSDELEDAINSYSVYLEEDLTLLQRLKSKFRIAFNRVLGFMNPPLWAMAASLFVASVPSLQQEFYFNNGFVQNTLSEAINQLGSVSIPLILIVLGSNLYPSKDTPAASKNYKKIVFGSLVSRMIIPPIILLPIIAIVAKLFPVSIVDDPIFLIVTFILTISPPAIQLSQICQLNEIFENEMAGVLFWGYVILTLPTTITTVAAALSALKWAVKS